MGEAINQDLTPSFPCVSDFVQRLAAERPVPDLWYEVARSIPVRSSRELGFYAASGSRTARKEL